MKPPRTFYSPLATGAPSPLREIPPSLSRAIHFVPPHLEKVRAKAGDLAKDVDVVLANLEDAIPADAKIEARKGAIEMGLKTHFAKEGSSFWVRINALNSPWHLDDLTEIVGALKDRLDVIMAPKIEGPWDIHYLDQLLALLEAKHGVTKPILLHPILETAQGVMNVEAIAGSSPRLQGMSLGPADLAASRKMKSTRVGGGHPYYRVLSDPHEDGRARESVQQDMWHYTIAKMVDACVTHGLLPYYGPFGAIDDPEACEQQFRNAYLLGCAGAWSLHPSQIAIAKKVFTPEPSEVKHALRVLEAMPDGAGVAMLDGKMQDDATWKQSKTIVDLARMIVAKEPEMAAAYGL